MSELSETIESIAQSERNDEVAAPLLAVPVKIEPTLLPPMSHTD